MDGTLVGLAALVYIGLLFLVAWLGDRGAGSGERILRLPTAVYALSLGVYCTSWTVYGAVGRAGAHGWDFMGVYLGPMALMTLGLPLLIRIVEQARAHNSTSVADLVATRYGKSQGLAALVTVISLIGLIPYIALQLKAVSLTFDLISRPERLSDQPVLASDGPLPDTAMLVAIAMACFTIAFGVRHVQSRVRNSGLLIAISLESLVKILAVTFAGAFVVFAYSGGLGALWEAAAAANVPENVTRPVPTATWLSITVLSGAAFLCLPHQFHVSVVEGPSRRQIRAAAWLFPLYLIAINAFVVPVAIAGILFLPAATHPDLYLLSLPLAAGHDAIALLVFIGGLSAATAMVIVATLALSTMICNELAVPGLIRSGWLRFDRHSDMGRVVLIIRRIAIVAILGIAYAFYRILSDAYALADIGMLAFAALAQIAPAFLAGMVWARPTRRAALAAILTGFIVFTYTFLLPAIQSSGLANAEGWLVEGPGGVSWLAPLALFGLGWLDPVSHATVWSLGLNALVLVAVSLVTRPTIAENAQAHAFVSPLPGAIPSGAIGPVRGPIRVADLQQLAGRFLGPDRAAAAYSGRWRGDGGNDHDQSPPGGADPADFAFTERLLAGAIGASSARLVMASAIQGGGLTRREAVAMLDDVSEAIRQNQDLLRATLESIAQGICVFDKDDRIVAWNRRFLVLLDLPEDLVRVGTTLSAIVSYNDQRGEYGTGHRQTTLAESIGPVRPVDRRRFERRRPDGTVLESRITPMPYGGFVATYTDVTDRVRAQEALQQSNETLDQRVRERTRALTEAKAEAERANRGKTQFLAAASHDLLQPLNAARLFASALTERARPGRTLSADDTGLIHNVDDSLKAVESLLGALLDISKLDAGAVEPDITVFPADALLSALGREFGAIARARGLDLRVVPCTSLLRSDQSLLRRVLQNFLSNALSYTRQGRVLIGARRRGDRLVIQVWDTGPGIPRGQQALIFQEFRRLEQRSHGEGGLGLGLAIVDRISRILDYPIHVSSTVGKGTMFSVTVPLAGTGVRPLDQPQATALTPFDGLVVLCIDNDPAILEGMRALLEGWGCRVVTATNRTGAMTVDATLPAEVILIDHHLGDDQTGFDVLDSIEAARGRSVTAALVTADRGQELRVAAETRDIPVLTKPVKPAALRAVLNRLSVRARAARGSGSRSSGQP